MARHFAGTKTGTKTGGYSMSIVFIRQDTAAPAAHPDHGRMLALCRGNGCVQSLYINEDRHIPKNSAAAKGDPWQATRRYLLANPRFRHARMIDTSTGYTAGSMWLFGDKSARAVYRFERQTVPIGTEVWMVTSLTAAPRPGVVVRVSPTWLHGIQIKTGIIDVPIGEFIPKTTVAQAKPEPA